MNTQLLLMGTMHHLKTSEYNGLTINKIQFLQEDDKKGIFVIEVKLQEEFQNDLALLKKGVNIQIPIIISSMDRAIFYKQSGKLNIK